MRRGIVIALAAAAFPPAAAARDPLPLLPPSGGEVTVIAGLAQPPLARYRRTTAGAAVSRRLDASSASSRAYLARLAALQARAVAELRRAIPQARVGYRYRIVLDGFAVTLPARKLPALARLGLELYPSVRYTEALDRSPGLIGATALEQATGADGRGIKIAVVDTGVDRGSPFLAADGLSAPPGFPRGDSRYTTGKVIVARSFPGPGAGAAGRLPFDASEPHGTHVAGIAAGNAGTRAPAGPDHPAVDGLSGVAPKAWIGNYRVFTVPTPLGHVADTPQIVAAFEAAVADGMDVINFSGGGAQTDPANDALVDAVANVAAAGVVPVIAAGNDRDDYGLGSVGSPATAPDSIAVAAVSNTHDFAPAARVTASGAPAALQRIPVMRGAGGDLPTGWARGDQTVVDVASQLCGPASDPNRVVRGTPPTGSLKGAIALVSRGGCSFSSKVLRVRAAGAIGVLLVDNRPGEANAIPEQEALPTAMISDLDGAALRAFVRGSGGRTTMRFGTAVEEIDTGRGGTITSFSSAGPTPFGHLLKPDLAAPGGQILSSTPPKTTGSTFSVFDGTSMATPHVAGAAALLLELHPTWTPRQVKSALVATAGRAWQDTARTQEASVLLAGGGLVDLPAANDPRVFTDPVSLSFADVHPGQRVSRLLTLTEAGGGAGTWQVEQRAQTASAGATVDVVPLVELAPGGIQTISVSLTVAADAAPGWDTGFLVLRQGAVERRVPYAFFVTTPRLPLAARPLPLRKRQVGDTRRGSSRVSIYCCPAAPFGPPPSYTGTPMRESGSEHVYVTHVNGPVANAGVSVVAQSPGASVDPWWLGSLDENDVQGYAGTPVNVNDLTPNVHEDVHAAGVVFPRQQEFFVAVDSGSDFFSGRARPGRYVLNSWVNDVSPPRLKLLNTRLAARTPVLAAQATDRQSGVDPGSLVVSYRGVLLPAESFDRASGLVLFPLGQRFFGRARVTLGASDYQEAKNVSTYGASILPNTRRIRVSVRAVDGPLVAWLLPAANSCVGRTGQLLLTATKPPRVVDGARRVPVRELRPGLYRGWWHPRGAGRHLLRASIAGAAAERVVCAR